MVSPEGEAPASRLALFSSLALFVVFVLLRVAFLIAREPFFDELFTRWISRQSFLQIVDVLRRDSGPPLFYFVLHAVGGTGVTIALARVVALVASCGAFLALLYAPVSREVRTTALLLLALYPAHLYFSTEGRAYALCASLVGLSAVLLVHQPEDEKGRLVAAVVLLLAAGYTHYYGAIFFGLPLLLSGSRRQLRAALIATAALVVGYIPVLLLLRQQPPMAIGWIHSMSWLEQGRSLVGELSMAADYPRAFLPPTPLALQLLAHLIFIAVSVWGVVRLPEARVWGSIVLYGAVAALALSFLGRPVYFPMRFESVLAVPLVLFLSTSLAALGPALRRVAALAMIVIAVVIWSRALAAFRLGASDPYREVARVARTIPSDRPLVASGASYLELLDLRDERWNPQLAAFPREQGQHPGWRSFPSPDSLAAEVSSLREQFIWIGEIQSPEAQALARRYRLRALYRSGGVVIASALRKPDGATSR